MHADTRAQTQSECNNRFLTSGKTDLCSKYCKESSIATETHAYTGTHTWQNYYSTINILPKHNTDLEPVAIA